MSNNPFFMGKPVSPEFFVGREYEIAFSFDQISNFSHLAIWGGPGMGRSSILELLASPTVWEKHDLDPSNAVIVLLTCENINPFTPSGFWQEVLRIMKDKLNSEFVLQTKIENLLEEGQATKDNLDKILQELGKKQKFLVLLVNEFDIALQENNEYTEANMQEFLTECRKLVVNSLGGRHLSIVVTSLKRLHELGPQLDPRASPWYNYYISQHLKLLNDTEIEQLLRAMTMTPALREAIKEIAGGHPTLLQIAGFLLYAQLETDRDVQEFIQKFETHTSPIFQKTWEKCNEIEQAILRLLALFDLQLSLHNHPNFDFGNIDLISSLSQVKELINLEEQGVIIKKQDKQDTVYSFSSLMMQRWVIQEMNNNQDVIQQSQEVFLQLISQRQLDKIELVWQHRDEIISTIEWFGNLVAAFPND